MSDLLCVDSSVYRSNARGLEVILVRVPPPLLPLLLLCLFSNDALWSPPVRGSEERVVKTLVGMYWSMPCRMAEVNAKISPLSTRHKYHLCVLINKILPNKYPCICRFITGSPKHGIPGTHSVFTRWLHHIHYIPDLYWLCVLGNINNAGQDQHVDGYFCC